MERSESRRHSRRHDGSDRSRRSRSPGNHRDSDRHRGRNSHDHRRSHTRSRSRSRSRHRHKRARRSHSPAPLEPLPFNAKTISKHDYAEYEKLFASYLAIQKDLTLSELDERERKGRFKSFVRKWNRGELSRGWYDPERRRRMEEIEKEVMGEEQGRRKEQRMDDRAGDEESSEDEYGPPVPGQERNRGPKTRVTLPTQEDLLIQKEQEIEARQRDYEDLRLERKYDRKIQKERLDDIVPRAEPGTRERQLEKKRELNDKLRSFRDKSPGAALELDEATLMGGGEESFQAKKAQMERKKNERELRKEAALRQRMQEREERLEEVRKREEKTMAILLAMKEEMLRRNGGMAQ